MTHDAGSILELALLPAVDPGERTVSHGSARQWRFVPLHRSPGFQF